MGGLSTSSENVRGGLGVQPRDGTAQNVKTADLAVGDVVLIRPGERILADGVEVAGPRGGSGHHHR